MAEYGLPLSLRQQNSFTEKLEASAAEHLALEHLDPVDVSFDDAGVPGQGEAGDDGVTVAVDACGEGVDGGQVVLADGIEPLR